MESLFTNRLILRRWRESDREPFAALNRHHEVMQFMPSPLSREASDAVIDRIELHFETHGFGFWATEERDTGAFVGMTGLAIPQFEADFMPVVEIGWRLARPFWGKGYATEAATAALDFGFDVLDLSEIVSFTVPNNLRSRAVMDRLGMRHRPSDDFDHPKLPEGDPLRRHVLYRKSNQEHKSVPGG